MNARGTLLALAAAPALAGCWVLIGESFTGYSDTSLGKTSNVGAPCVIDGDADTMCGTAPNHKCKESGNDGFPGGYCTISPCDQIALCPIGATCADLAGESDVACYKSCASNADCRTPDYSCFELGVLYRSGAGTKICHPNAFSCYRAEHCPPAKSKCNADQEAGALGFCTP